VFDEHIVLIVVCNFMAKQQSTFQSKLFALAVRARRRCITQLKAQGPSRTCNESKEGEEEEEDGDGRGGRAARDPDKRTQP